MLALLIKTLKDLLLMYKMILSNNLSQIKPIPFLTTKDINFINSIAQVRVNIKTASVISFVKDFNGHCKEKALDYLTKDGANSVAKIIRNLYLAHDYLLSSTLCRSNNR